MPVKKATPAQKKSNAKSPVRTIADKAKNTAGDVISVVAGAAGSLLGSVENVLGVKTKPKKAAPKKSPAAKKSPATKAKTAVTKTVNKGAKVAKKAVTKAKVATKRTVAKTKAAPKKPAAKRRK